MGGKSTRGSLGARGSRALPGLCARRAGLVAWSAGAAEHFCAQGRANGQARDRSAERRTRRVGVTSDREMIGAAVVRNTEQRSPVEDHVHLVQPAVHEYVEFAWTAADVERDPDVGVSAR